VTLMALRQMASVSLFAPLVFVGLVLLIVFQVAQPASASDVPRRIVLLEGLTPTQPAVVQTVEGFERRLKQRKAGNIEVVTEFLDLGRFRGPEADERFVQFLSSRFAEEPASLIVTISGGATTFMIRNRDRIARGVPIVYCCSPTLAGDALTIPSDIPGVEMKYDWVGTLALAERLQPNATTLVIVSGDSSAARLYERDALESLRPIWGDSMHSEVVSSRADELIREVSKSAAEFHCAADAGLQGSDQFQRLSDGNRSGCGKGVSRTGVFAGCHIVRWRHRRRQDGQLRGARRQGG
jgi:hypothetical protein